MRNSQHALALLCVAGLSVGLARADEIPSVTVTVPHPLDKVRVMRLYERIEMAARQVCEPLDSAELARKRIYRTCVTQAVERAVADARSRELTQVHLSHRGATVPTL